MQHQNTRLKLFSLLKPYKGQLTIGALALAVTTACMLYMPQYLRLMFDTALSQGDMSVLNEVFMGLGITVVVLLIGVFIRSYMVKIIFDHLIRDFRTKVYDHILSLGVDYFERTPAGEIISRAGTDISTIRDFFESALPLMLRGGLLAVGTAAMLLVTNMKLTLYVLGIGILLAGITYVAGKIWRKHSLQMRDAFAHVLSRQEQTFWGIYTVKALGMEKWENAKHRHLLDACYTVSKKLAWSRAVFFSANVMLGFVAIGLVLWLGGRDVIAGTMTQGDLMAYLLYLAFLGDGLSSLANFWPAFANVQATFTRVQEVMAERADIQAPEAPKTLPSHTEGNPIRGRNITLKNINFTYPARPEMAALESLSFTITAGETVAIVGPSGAGKSTLFSLLLRFYDPQTGSIEIDGVPLTDMTPEDYRSHLAIVPQESVIFSGTIGENIAYGVPEANAEEVQNAAELADAWGFIQQFEKGLETVVGEKGVRLSGGQKQRISLARAVLRNPDILLLDEATSHLDAKAEAAVQKALEHVKQGRTTLIIAHRLATVQAADRILVLDQGKLVATGTHEELMQQEGLYQHLASLQFLHGENQNSSIKKAA